MKSIADIAAARILALGLTGPAVLRPVDVASPLLSLQGHDLRGALESVALRTADRDPTAVVTALAEGLVVRSWTQRGTLHLVAAGDVGWLLDLTAARMMASMVRRRAQLGIDDATIAQATELAMALIGERGRVSRQGLLAAWEPLGVGEVPGRGYHLIVALAIRQVLVQGPLAESGPLEQLFVLSRDWLPEQRRLPPDEALAELVGRYVSSHGPCTIADLARWVGLPVGEIRAGVAASRAAGTVTTTDIAQTTYLHSPDLPDQLAAHRAEAQALLLLPGFDELILGYRDRSATLDPAHEALVVPGGNGMFKATIVEKARAIGTWRRSNRVSGPRVEATAFPGSRLNQRRIEKAAAAYPAFGRQSA